MTRDEIESLIPLIPTDSHILFTIPGAYTEYWDIAGKCRFMMQKWSWLLNIPDFASKFSLSFAKKGLPLPQAADVQPMTWLMDVNNFQRGIYRNEYNTIRSALTFKSEANRIDKNLLDGLLLTPDISYEDIAKRFKTTAKVIRLYEQLFWNVRDRADERVYIGKLLYPDGNTLDEFDPNYLYHANSRIALLRVAVRYGAATLLANGGVPEAANELNSEEWAKRHEGDTMYGAVMESRMSGGHGYYPAATRAERLIQSGKMSGQESKTAEDILGLESLSAHFPVMQTLEKLTGDAVRHMLELDTAEAKADAINKRGDALDADTKQMSHKPADNWVEDGWVMAP